MKPTHRLTTSCAKNYCNRTLIVKVIIENVVTCFLGHGVHGIVAGKRRRGRPRRRWTDDIKQWTGISVAECVQHAKDRSAWTALVSVSVTSDPQS